MNAAFGTTEDTFALLTVVFYLCLKDTHPRGDYKELLELAVLFLGGVLPEKQVYAFKKPGALSKTRFMMRGIYAIKTWLFGRQLRLASNIDSKLFALSVFVCRVYVARLWYTAPLATAAPRNDLAALQFLWSNRKLGLHWDAALQKFSKHLWYLSPKLVLFALFDDGLPIEEKRAMAAALHSSNGKPADVLPVRAKVKLDKTVLQLKLHDFVSAESMRFFDVCRLPSDFLSLDPAHWAADEGFVKCQQVVKQFKVVNDAAERAVQLATRFMKGNQLTHDEDARQLMFLVVAEDRKANKLR